MNWQDNGEEEEDPGKGCSWDWDTLGQAEDAEGSIHRMMEEGEGIGVNAQEPEQNPSPEPEKLLSPQTPLVLRCREQWERLCRRLR